MKTASVALIFTSQALAFSTKSSFSKPASYAPPLDAATFSPDDNTNFSPQDLQDPNDNDQNNDNNKRSNEHKVMSPSLPFLPCPKLLKDCEFSGNVGFDPLGLAQTKEQLWRYREAEMKHARLAMLAAVGWPASELWDRAIASHFATDPVLDVPARAPSLFIGGLDRVSPIWWGFCIGLCAAIDMFGVAKVQRGDTGYQPGKLGFDPMGLYPKDAKGQKWMDEAEIKHGRLAMVAVVVYAWEEWVSKLSLVDETRALFQPFAKSAEMLGEAVGVEEASPLLMSPLADELGRMAFE